MGLRKLQESYRKNARGIFDFFFKPNNVWVIGEKSDVKNTIVSFTGSRGARIISEREAFEERFNGCDVTDGRTCVDAACLTANENFGVGGAVSCQKSPISEPFVHMCTNSFFNSRERSPFCLYDAVGVGKYKEVFESFFSSLFGPNTIYVIDGGTGEEDASMRREFLERFGCDTKLFKIEEFEAACREAYMQPFTVRQY